ncbi:hypothetical protein [Photobacterium damselae]|uniref:hypothetical protein n=1 Tax=Photobacterium damselae TaxID=38293 RepID=UPI004067B7ED
MSVDLQLLADFKEFYEARSKEYIDNSTYKEAHNGGYRRIIVLVDDDNLSSVHSFIMRYNTFQESIVESCTSISTTSKIFSNKPSFATGVKFAQLIKKETYKFYDYTGARLARKLQLIRRSRKGKANKELLDDEIGYFRRFKDVIFTVRKSGYSELRVNLHCTNGDVKQQFVKQGILFIYSPDSSVVVKPFEQAKQFGVRRKRNRFEQLTPIATTLDLNGDLYLKSDVEQLLNPK